MTESKTNSLYTTHVTVEELEAIDISHPQFTARLFLQGAHLTHFAPRGSDSWLWLSPEARFERGRAIRGGIPVCWPWFGDPPRNPDPVAQRIQSTKAHGFARTHIWSVSGIKESPEAVEITLCLDAQETGSDFGEWPLSATLTFRFNREACQIDLTTHNAGDSEVAFTEALHTYFPTPAIEQSHLHGFEDARFTDTLEDWQEKPQTGRVSFAGETDRIYHRGGPILVQTPARTMKLDSHGSGSTIVWNPGPAKAERLSDFPDDAWKTMLCVETANAFPDCVRLIKGASHTTSLRITCA